MAELGGFQHPPQVRGRDMPGGVGLREGVIEIARQRDRDALNKD